MVSLALACLALVQTALAWGTNMGPPGTIFDIAKIEVYNGKTVFVTPKGKTKGSKMRLGCIDAPEYYQGEFFAQSKASLENLVAGASGPLKARVVQAQDEYKRPVIELFHGKTDLNVEMVAQGAAFAYPYYLAKQKLCNAKAYLAAEKTAREDMLGVWTVSGNGLARPWVCRKDPQPCKGTLNAW